MIRNNLHLANQFENLFEKYPVTAYKYLKNIFCAVGISHSGEFPEKQIFSVIPEPKMFFKSTEGFSQFVIKLSGSARELNFSKFRTEFARKMSNWEREKDKYLNMKAEEKQKNSISLDKIPTWKSMCETEKLPNAVSRMENCPIDASKNEKLAQKISIFEGDITKLAIDAIVNAANSRLQGGGGVDGAIHRAAGSCLRLEGASLAPCKTGDAKITGGYQLPAKYVIHTVGPQLDRPGQLENRYVNLLENCYNNSLQLLISKNLRSIAFPCISTGIYGYPNLPAAHTAAYEVRKFLEKEHDKVDRVIFCLFLEQDRQIYREILQSYFPN